MSHDYASRLERGLAIEQYGNAPDMSAREVLDVVVPLIQADTHRHIPTLTEKQGGWGVFCDACSHEAGNYVERCKRNPDWWPPLLLDARAAGVGEPE